MMHYWNSYSWWSPMPFWEYGVWGFLGAVLFTAFVVAVLALKGYALWFAAKRDEKWWFVAMLVVNTAGLLELFYLLFIVKKWRKGLKSGSMGANEAGKDDHGQTQA